LNYTRTGGRFYGPPVAVGKWPRSAARARGRIRGFSV